MLHSVLDGRFKLEECLSRSTTAEMFRAVDQQSGKAVAVKLMRPRVMMTANFGARLKQEFQVLRQLEHPNIIHAIQTGQTSDNMVYIAMEFINGPTLEEMLAEKGPLPATRVADYLDQIAGALDDAHSKGFIHRNLSPACFRVAKGADGKELVKVYDFGLAKALDPESEANMMQTGAGVLIGTPAYMSPEQAMGKDLKHTSDIYTVGVTVFQLLTGKLPFEETSEVDTAIAHVKKPIPAFSAKNPSVSVPPMVEDVVRKAMSKKPAERHQTVTEFARAFRAALAGRRLNIHSSAMPAGAKVELSGGKGDKMGLYIGIGAAALAVLAAGIYFATRGG